MTKNLISHISIACGLLLINSCTLAPKYEKPASPIALEKISEIEIVKNNKKSAIKKAEATIVEPITSEVLWRDYFIDDKLQEIIELTLKNNRDLKVAALNIEAARSYYRISRADLLPQISAQNSLTKTKSSGSNYQPTTSFASKLALTSFEIDLFGKLRSLKDAALQDFFATQQAHDTVQISLIAEVLNAYLEFLLNHQNMILAYDIVQAAEEKFRITQIRYDNGIDSKAKFLEEKTQLNNAKITLANYKKTVSQNKNILQILIGSYDKTIFDGYSAIQELDDIKIAHDLLRFIPSSKLLSRPDILQAEYGLKAANANIGAARAAFFPSIMLTGDIGYSSNKLNKLFSSSSIWSYSPQINIPIFSGGSNIANLKLSHIRKKIEIVKYEQAIQNAFKELLDQLAIKKSAQEHLKLSTEIVELQDEVYEITLAKYDFGNESKYNMLSQKINFLKTQQQYLQSKKDYLSNLINLYKVLGGGVRADRNKAEA